MGPLVELSVTNKDARGGLEERRRALEILRDLDGRRAERFSECGRWRRCGMWPLCRPCWDIRIRNFGRTYIDILAQSTRPRYVVLSQRAVAQLDPSTVRAFSRKLRRFSSRAAMRRAIKGGFYTVEITGRPGKWNIHANLLVDVVPGHFSKSKVRKAWFGCKGGFKIAVKPIWGLKGLLSYSAKMPDLLQDKEIAREWIKETFGRRLRLAGSWGSVRAGRRRRAPIPPPALPLIGPELPPSRPKPGLLEVDARIEHRP